MPVDTQATVAAVDSGRATGLLPDNVRAPLPDERIPSAGIVPQSFYEEGAHAGQAGPNSTRVGFTLRDTKGKIVDAFAFRINPQGLDYTLGSRATMYAVKSGFYTNDFGPAASVIALRQLVMTGKNAYLNGPFYTAREDVQRFMKQIFLPAINGSVSAPRRVFFHDHHFERGFEQRVVFLADSLTVSRATETPGLWRVELQMVSLEKFPYAEVSANKVPQKTSSGKQYRVKRGDTLEKIVRNLAGKGASASKRKKVQAALLAANPQLRKKRTQPNGQPAKPMKVYAGELLALP